MGMVRMKLNMLQTCVFNFVDYDYSVLHYFPDPWFIYIGIQEKTDFSTKLYFLDFSLLPVLKATFSQTAQQHIVSILKIWDRYPEPEKDK